MGVRIVRTAITFVVGLIGVCGVFVVSTVLNATVSNGIVAATICAGASAALLLFAGTAGLGAAWRDHRSWVLLAAAGGAVTLFLPPLIVMTQRASDAPPGSEVAFFTLSTWGFLGVLGWALQVRTRRAWVPLAAAVLAATAGAILLASWEFPSSFSPFVRFPVRHVLMIFAGALFVAGTAAVLTSARRIGVRSAVSAAAFAGIACSVGVAIAQADALPDAIAGHQGALLTLALCAGMFLWPWFRLSSDHTIARAATMLLLAPAALSGLIVVERATRVFGPDPVRWSAATAAIITALAGAAVIWLSATDAREARDDAPVQRPRRPLAIGSAVLALLALATLATPGVRGSVEGAFGELYQASWSMPGIETASGWLVVSLSMLAVAAVVAEAAGEFRAAAAASIAVLTSAGAYLFVAATPLRTATLWIPADVQQTYGTEYARLTFVAIHDPLRLAVLAGSAVLSVIVLLMLHRARRNQLPSEVSS